jgi:galactonate dehydratase
MEMKIKTIELFKVAPRWLFLKITTNNGIEGWGEPIVEGKADTVAATVKDLSEYLLGKDPRQIEDIWYGLYIGGFYRGGPILMSAIAGIDQALWDIKGKALGVPVYELIGGAVRNKMKMYSWVGGDKPANVVAAAKTRVEQGYKAIKMNACSEMEMLDTPKKIKQIASAIQAVRDVVGDEIGIGIDFHGRVHKAMAKLLIEALDPIKPMFYEEPVLSEYPEAFSALSRYTSTPIATGERLYSRWEYKKFLESSGVDIIQPDLSHAGGITEVKKIATMAEAYDVALAPHCPLGPISLAAALNIDFNCINATIQESSIGIHYNQGADLLDYVANPEIFEVTDGYISRWKEPGLGVKINEEKVREMAEKGHNWKNPVWRNADGSITEW